MTISVNVLWKTSERIICFIFQGLQSVRCPFSDVGDYLVSQFATTDNYSTDFQIFTLNGLSVGVENDLLSEALRELPDKKREILLLFYFMDMSDSEIADLLKLNRSTVYRHRTSGLALIKKFMEEFEE
ncbi:RNA polymerase sigma factor [Gardnerella vaginalis]|uniref:RNA polymerase sigma factor n=1 Tax=Gardnerella vaginalis TaxID=2702 RepID=UPI003F5ABEB2